MRAQVASCQLGPHYQGGGAVKRETEPAQSGGPRTIEEYQQSENTYQAGASSVRDT